MSTLIDIIETSVQDIQNSEGLPEFRGGDVLEVDSELTRLNRSFATKYKMFPFVYMQYNYKQKEIIKNKSYSTDLLLYIVNEANADYTFEERRQNEWDTLIDLRKSILRSLELNGITYENIDSEKIEFYKSEENKLSIPINIMELNLEIFYCLT